MIFQEFLCAFRKVKEALDCVYRDVLEMNSAVQNMTSQLQNTKSQTHQLIEQTTKLQAERYNMLFLLSISSFPLITPPNSVLHQKIHFLCVCCSQKIIVMSLDSCGNFLLPQEEIHNFLKFWFKLKV